MLEQKIYHIFSPLQTDKDIFQKGIQLFNDGEFFECHEVFEKIWLNDLSKDRLFHQGLIQVAAGFHHARKGRIGPAGKMIQKALEKLASYPEVHGGIRLAHLRREVREWKPGRPFPKIESEA
ncbi:MAG: DUF309 domain-containing protein [Deltaproteobacteria bacterium]|nr:DUF309 domain-containing protein [Deltaproteobacteria bacterium]